MRSLAATTRRVLGRAVWVVQAVWLLACKDLTPPADATPEVPGPVITADKDSYSWKEDDVAVFTLSNPEGASVYWAACPNYRVQRYENGWQTVRMPRGVLPSEGVCDPRRLAAGQTVEHRIPLTSDWIPRSGWYRLELNLVRDSNPELPWALRSRTSPSVRIAP